MMDKAGWITLESKVLNRKNLEDLIENRIPIIKINNFASHEELQQLEASANKVGFGCYSDIQPRIDKIGITIFEHEKDVKAYFDEVNRAKELADAIYSESFNPVARLIDFIKIETGMELNIARHHSYGSYYAGTIRKMPSGTLLHIDYAPCEEPKFDVGSVRAQLGWNLYVEHTCTDGGHLRIYNRTWVPEDNKFREGRYGYASQLVSGCQFIDISPVRGDLYIFNTRNYHQVAPSSGIRMTVNSQIGVTNEGKMVLWS